MNSLQLAFDYGELPQQDVKALEKHAIAVLAINERQRKTTADNILKLGKELADAQKRLSHRGNGTFGKWCVERCGISRMTAHNAITAFGVFGGANCKTVLQSFDATALYLLSAETCPEDATKDAINAAKRGEVITKKAALEFIEKYTADSDDELSGDLDGDYAIEEIDDAEPSTADDDFDPTTFLLSVQREARRWYRRCSKNDIDLMQDMLRAVIDELEVQKNASAGT